MPDRKKGHKIQSQDCYQVFTEFSQIDFFNRPKEESNKDLTRPKEESIDFYLCLMIIIRCNRERVDTWYLVLPSFL